MCGQSKKGQQWVMQKGTGVGQKETVMGHGKRESYEPCKKGVMCHVKGECYGPCKKGHL